ncbi:cytidylate kinase [Spiroplasma helicoides]|uniref:Cytidylate kinase n=1 Tax=Spiroplasma helicoides TaxID=216938 RepID=A0A1B3SJV7_9MOLU|nr:(d)CMP kinase [Spiroplasma helicoides]AOG60212.1 cytidylate kinase [Spiroplasma helicoides]
MNKKINVAVDGTASSGKSSVMNIVAKNLGFKFIDTGLMYRAFTKFCINEKIDFLNTNDILKKLEEFDCIYKDDEKIFVRNKDYTAYLSDYDVTKNISYISVVPKVREKMVEMQKQMALCGGVIMVGRDITTVVLPEADIKLYFDCSPEVRAKRRFLQNQKNNIEPNVYEDILDGVIKRDLADKGRSVGALKIAKDAIVIDTSNMTLEEVINSIENKINNYL